MALRTCNLEVRYYGVVFSWPLIWSLTDDPPESDRARKYYVVEALLYPFSRPLLASSLSRMSDIANVDDENLFHTVGSPRLHPPWPAIALSTSSRSPLSRWTAIWELVLALGTIWAEREREIQCYQTRASVDDKDILSNHRHHGKSVVVKESRVSLNTTWTE